jgi:hypothetical protein
LVLGDQLVVLEVKVVGELVGEVVGEELNLR